MTNSQATKAIKFYSELFVNIIAKSIAENIDGIEAGRLALRVSGCPSDVSKAIEKSMMKQLS